MMSMSKFSVAYCKAYPHFLEIPKFFKPRTFHSGCLYNFRLKQGFNKKRLIKVNEECDALLRLLNRSNICLLNAPLNQKPCLSLISRFLHTTPPLWKSPDNQVDKKEKNQDEDEKKDKDGDENPIIVFITLFFFLMAGIATVINLKKTIWSENQPENLQNVSWSEFLHQMLAKGEVKEVVVRTDLNLVTINVHDNAVIKGKTVPIRSYHMEIVDVESFERKLREAEQSLGIAPENGVPVIYDRNLESIWSILATVAGLGLFVMLMSQLVLSDMKGSFRNMGSMLGKARFTLVDPLTGKGKGVKFKDVAGLKEAKQEVMELVDYLKKPERYKSLGAKVPKGVLLLGPPGCGKTMLAKAIATESNVPFLAMAGSEFIEMIGGLGAARVRDLFKQAGKRSPCIIYVDEIDAIGRKRSGGAAEGTTGEQEQTLNQLLVEMDGMATKEGVLMLASTNRPDVLDKALLRPGRFDRHILIDLPTLVERREIFEQHLKLITLEKKPKDYSQRLAQLTPGFSGADIANVANESALHAARSKQKSVNSENLEYAIERVIGGTEKRSQVMALEEKRVVAFHECGHALVGWMLKHTDALMKVSIIPRTTNIHGFSQYLPNDNKLYSTEQLFERMCMALGGRVAESLVFNRISTGAEDDLKKVTKMAYAQIQQYGMNPVIGPLYFPTQEEMTSGGQMLGKKPFSKRLAAVMDQQARLLIAQVYKETERVLLQNMNKLELLAEMLLKKEVLNYADIEELIGPSPHGKKNLIETVEWGPEADTSNSNSKEV